MYFTRESLMTNACIQLLLTLFWVDLSYDQPKKDLEKQSWTVSMDKNKQFIF